MAKLSEIKLPDNNTYEFKDSDAQYAIRHLANSTVSNLINITNVGSYTVDGVLISINSDGRVYIDGTATADISFLLSEDFYNMNTQSSCVMFIGDATTDGSSDTWWLELSLVGSSYISYDETPISLPNMIISGDLYLHIKSGTNLEDVGFYPMIVETALYNIGVRSGSYGPTNHELYLSLKFAQQTINKMNKTAGSVTNPIYFADGVPTPCTYTIEKSVPSDAVFTDTTYESKSASSGGTAVSLCTTGEKYEWNHKADLGDITALQTSITSSTSITAYVNALSKGHYVTYYASTSKPSDAPVNANCFVEIFVYSSTTALVRVTPTSSSYFGTVYEINKLVGTWQTQWVSHGYGMLIPDNTDINTITTVGDYFIGTGTSAETMTNLPTSARFSGHLIVSGLNAVDKTRLMQMYIPSWNTTDKMGKIFVRHLINTGQWTDWIMISDNILMAELVDRDGKNLLANDAGTKTVGTITFTMNDDRSIAVSGTSRTSNSDYYICTDMPLKAGTYVLSGCPSGGNNSSTYKIQINGVGYDIGDSYEFTLSSDTTITVYIRIWSGYTPNNLVFKPMICTKSDWIISKAYVPNALSNLELTLYHTGKMLSSNIDLDTLLTEGTWYGFNAVGSTASNLPIPNGNFNIRVENVMIGAVYLRQSCYIAQIQHVYTEFVRVKNISSGGAWQPWMMVIAHGAAGLNLAANDDLNNYTTPGIYQCTGPTVGATLSNSPTGQPFRMEVKYFATTSSIIQEISGINDTTSGECEIYYRVKLSSGWKSWVKISKDMPSTYELGTSLASNSDLNSLTTPGKWYATSSAIADTISHSPVSGVAFFGETIPSVAGSRYIQILYPNDDTGDWYKRRYTGSWQVWIKYTGTPVS